MRVVFALLALTFGLASAGTSAAEQDKPKIDWQIKQAYKHFSRADETALADERLRLYVLRTKDSEKAVEQRALIASQKYAPTFIDRFDASLAWRKRLDADDGRAAFSLSVEYGQRQGDKLFERIASSLMRLAARKEYPPALKKQAAAYLRSVDAEKRERGCNYLKKLGETGDVDSALRLGRMYMAGDILEQDDERALFWLTKTLRNRMDADIPDWRDALYERQPDGRFAPKKGSEEKVAQLASDISPHLESWIEELRRRTSPKDRLNNYLSLRSDDIPIGCLINRAD